MTKCWDVLRKDKDARRKCYVFWGVRVVAIVILGTALGSLAESYIIPPSSVLVVDALKILQKKHGERLQDHEARIKRLETHRN